MKKTKLLMPILGISAIAGAVVPAAVSCTPAEQKEGIELKLNAVLDDEDELLGDIVSFTCETPRGVSTKDLKVTATWVQWNVATEIEEYTSMCTAAAIVPEKGEATPLTLITSECTVGKAVFNVPKALIKEGNSIYLYIHADQAASYEQPITVAESDHRVRGLDRSRADVMHGQEIFDLTTMLEAQGGVRSWFNLYNYETLVQAMHAGEAELPTIEGKHGFYLWFEGPLSYGGREVYYQNAYMTLADETETDLTITKVTSSWSSYYVYYVDLGLENGITPEMIGDESASTRIDILSYFTNSQLRSITGGNVYISFDDLVY